MIKIWIIIEVTAVVIAIITFIFKFDRYKDKDGTNDGFIKTKEKFIEKGKTTEVYYNPKTGERSYKKVKS
jgi:hypothetical protein